MFAASSPFWISLEISSWSGWRPMLMTSKRPAKSPSVPTNEPPTGLMPMTASFASLGSGRRSAS